MRLRAVQVCFLLVGAALYAACCGELLDAQSPAAQGAANDVRAKCGQDVQKLCANVPAGGGRIIACLKQHQDQVSDGCKQAIAKAMQQANGGAGPAPATSTPPADAQPGTRPEPSPAPPAAAAPKNSQPPSSTKSNSPGHYFLMKQVQIIDQGLGQGKPAYDLMIPKDWQFKGWVNVGVAEGGCFADWFSAVGDAKSADNSIELQILPKYTWQYIDDPAGQRQMQQKNAFDAKAKIKPCPVRAPVKAEEFLRRDLLEKYRKGKTVVSVAAFPSLDQLVRYRMGLPPSGGDVNGFHTEGARARLSYDDEKGQPVEEWVTAEIVVRKIPMGSRGAAYDWHAVNVMSFRTPKGQLDANDRLFKLIASTIRPEPDWQKWSNGVIASLYQKKQEEAEKQAEIIQDFQNKVVQTINEVTANQMRGSMQSANGTSQLIREVQTFRDPTTGSTFELSNKFDNAWRDPNSQYYVMSDDANFNPNGKLDGNWTQLELVRPQP
jgi:Cysteine rich repeat